MNPKARALWHAALDAEDLFRQRLAEHSCDRWHDTKHWPAPVRAAFAAKVAATEAWLPTARALCVTDASVAADPRA